MKEAVCSNQVVQMAVHALLPALIAMMWAEHQQRRRHSRFLFVRSLNQTAKSALSSLVLDLLLGDVVAGSNAAQIQGPPGRQANFLPI
jgi:hypothetical protein